MNISSKDILRRLGTGASIDAVRAEAGLSAEQFRAWWQEEIRSRVPRPSGTALGRGSASSAHRARYLGYPHIFADNDPDLFFGFGYALAQDRLFQLDFLRRKGAGRLSEIVGADGAELDVLARTVGFRNILELDLLARTVGLRRIAEAEWQRLPEETRKLLQAFTDGINALMEETRDRPPIEFDLLDYRPEPWSPIDCLTIESEFRWYLTGRFPVIVMPELARSVLGDGPLYQAFLRTRAGRGEHPAAGIVSARPLRRAAGGHRGRRPARRRGQQQLGGGRQAHALGQADGGQRSAHRLRGGVMLVRGPPVRRLVPGGGDGVCRDAGGDVRPQRARRLGLHQQHLLAARPVPGEDRPGPSGLLPVRRPMGAGPYPGGGHSRQGRATGPADDPLFAQRSHRRRRAAAAGAGRRSGVAEVAGRVRGRLADGPARHGPGEVGGGVSRGPATLARADLLRGLRRRGRPHRLPGDRPHSRSARSGSAAIGPAGPPSTSGTA